MITGGNWILENVLFYEWRWKYWDCLNFRVPPLNICTVGDWWEVQICLTWNFADNVDTSQYRYKNQLPFSARSCHTNDKFCLSPAFSPLWYGHSDSVITRWLWTFLVCLRLTHLSALFVIVGFTPSWNLLVTWSMSLTSASPGSSGHICSSLCPVSSLEPGNGRTNTYRVSWHALTSPSPIARVQSLMFPSLFVIYFSQVFVIFWQLASVPSWFYCGV